MSELKPCPFGCCPDDAFDAGSAAVLTDFNDLGWFALCTQCSAVGPTADSDAEAIAAWNRRSPSLSQEEREALEEGARALDCGIACTESLDGDAPIDMKIEAHWKQQATLLRSLAHREKDCQTDTEDAGR